MVPIDPKVDAIQTDEEYEAVMAEIDRLFDAEPGTPDGDALEQLVAIVMAYEKEHFLLGDWTEACDPANEAWD